MKKIIAMLISVLILTGCSSSIKYEDATASESAPQINNAVTEESYDAEAYEFSEKNETNPNEFSEKIAYTIYTNLETKTFDESIEKLNNSLEKYNGFIEFSSLYGDTRRYADYTLRVPTESYKAFLEELSTVGNIYSMETIAENLTSQFYDTDARLKTLLLEEERLLEILKNATEISDIITLEERLSQVRYEIESLQTTLNSINLMVDYSTIHISVSEVVEFENTEGFFDRLIATFKNSFRDLGYGTENFVLSAVYIAPFLIIFFGIIFIIYKILKKPVKKLIKKIVDTLKKM